MDRIPEGLTGLITGPTVRIGHGMAPLAVGNAIGVPVVAIAGGRMPS